MKPWGRTIVGIAAAVALVAVLAISVTAAGNYAAFSRAAEAGWVDQLAQTACKMRAGPVSWYEVLEEGELGDEVESYETEPYAIVGIFEYNCVPKNATIVTQWDIEGETVASFKEKLPASSKKGEYQGWLSKKDDSPLDDGEYGVTFFNNKTELTSGIVTVGEVVENGGEDGATVSVEGTVSDKRTGKGIRGALVIVLYPETDIEQWIENEMPEEDLWTAAETGSRGEFVLDELLDRNVPYPFIVAAEGYKPILEQEVVFDDEAEDPVVLNIELTK